MRILTRYTVNAVLGWFFGGMVAFTSLLLGVQLLNILHTVEEYHIPLILTMKMVSLFIPLYITYGASISVLFAILLGIGNLTSHSEITAMRAGGLSFYKLAVPILIIGLAVSVSGVMLNEYLVPISLQTYDKMKAEAISQDASGTINQFNKVFQDKDLQKLIYADTYEPKVKELHNVIIQELLQGKLKRTISAAVMYWGGKGWYFTHAQIYQYTADSFFPITVDKGKVDYELNITPKEIEQINIPPEEESISELNNYIHKFATGVERQRLLVDLHTKVAIPFASFVFAILGTPLALRPQRRSNAAGVGLCLIYMIIWYCLSGLGDSLSRGGSIPPYLGAWLPNIVLASYGIYVFFRVKS